MIGHGCPREPEILAATRRGRSDPAIEDHLRSCPGCRSAAAADRTLARLAAAEDERPFPSAAALRLEAELRREERRLAGRARRLVGLHVGALAVSLALLAAARALEARLDPRVSAFGSAGSICAVVAVALCLWNLVRTAEESPLPF